MPTSIDFVRNSIKACKDIKRRVNTTSKLQFPCGMCLSNVDLSRGDSYIRGDRGAVSEGMLMDQTIRKNMSKNRPKIPGKCRQCNQDDRVK